MKTARSESADPRPSLTTQGAQIHAQLRRSYLFVFPQRVFPFLPPSHRRARRAPGGGGGRHGRPLARPGDAGQAVRPVPSGRVSRAGHRPAAVFQERWLALLAAGVLPGTGRDAAFRLHKESGPDGFAVEAGNGSQTVGHLELFDENLIAALHVVERLVRLPEALANVLEAAGQITLERVGAILDERVPEGTM
jgi:hypothetical protein